MQEQMTICENFAAIDFNRWVREAINGFADNRENVIREFHFLKALSKETMHNYVTLVIEGIKINDKLLYSNRASAMVSIDNNGLWIKLRIRDEDDIEMKYWQQKLVNH